MSNVGTITTFNGDIANIAWTTDKARISTGTNSVTLMIRTSGKPNSNDDQMFNDGNVGSGVLPIVPANSTIDLYVGVGNKLTITGGNSSAMAIGTASSADAGVMD